MVRDTWQHAQRTCQYGWCSAVSSASASRSSRATRARSSGVESEPTTDTELGERTVRTARFEERTASSMKSARASKFGCVVVFIACHAVRVIVGPRPSQTDNIQIQRCTGRSMSATTSLAGLGWSPGLQTRTLPTCPRLTSSLPRSARTAGRHR